MARLLARLIGLFLRSKVNNDELDPTLVFTIFVILAIVAFIYAATTYS